MPLLLALNLWKTLTFPSPQLARFNLCHLTLVSVSVSIYTLTGWCLFLFVSQGLFLLTRFMCMAAPSLFLSGCLTFSFLTSSYSRTHPFPALIRGDHFIIMDLILDLGWAKCGHEIWKPRLLEGHSFSLAVLHRRNLQTLWPSTLTSKTVCH